MRAGLETWEMRQALFAVPEAIERKTGDITRLAATRRGMEHWFTQTFQLQLARAPWRVSLQRQEWNRRGVRVEHQVDLPDSRMAFVQRTGRTMLFLDMVVPAVGAQSEGKHVIECKFVSMSQGPAHWSRAIEGDLDRVRAVSRRPDFVSGWVLLAITQVQSPSETRRRLAEMLGSDRLQFHTLQGIPSRPYVCLSRIYVPPMATKGR